MKNTLKYIFATLVASVTLSTAINAQVVAKKTATNNYDGTYTLTMEAYATGSESVVVTDNKTPIDAVLVLDCSQSMDSKITSSGTSYLMSTTTLADLLSSNQSSSSYYIFWSDSKYYKVTVNNRTATFTVNGTTYGVTYNNGTYSTPSGNTEIPAAYRTIVLHTSTTSNISRIQALKEACSIFLSNLVVDQVQWNASHTDKTITHRVSIISFNKTATTNVAISAGNVEDNYSSIISTVNNLGLSQGTYSNLGMANAITEINSARSEASKLVVFFTDGTPGNQSNTFSTEIANGAIANSKTIKDKGASVFALSVIEITSGSQMDKYMNYVSSNYPNAESMTNYGTSTSSDFYSIATNQEQLNKAFDSISGSAISGGTSASVDATSYIQDVVGEAFTIPAGATSQNIKIYTDNFQEIQSGVYIFENNWTDAGLTPTVSGKTVTVDGFDYKDNYCGYRVAKDSDGNIIYEGGKPKMVAEGKKLVMQITIVPDPDSESIGYAETNDDSNSGIYTSDGTAVEHFVTVPSKVYTNSDLTVKVSGLEEGETAIFIVTANVPLNMYGTSKEFKRTVALTGPSASAIVKAPVVYLDDTETAQFVKYTVTPLAKWAWTYTVIPDADKESADNISGTAISKAIIKIQDDETRVADNVYEFIATKKTDLVVNGENSKTNNFQWRDDNDND